MSTKPKRSGPGATGKQGGAVARALLSSGTSRSRRLTRKPDSDAARRSNVGRALIS